MASTLFSNSAEGRHVHACCPVCRASGSAVRNRVQRRLTDLPAGGKLGGLSLLWRGAKIGELAKRLPITSITAAQPFDHMPVVNAPWPPRDGMRVVAEAIAQAAVTKATLIGIEPAA